MRRMPLGTYGGRRMKMTKEEKEAYEEDQRQLNNAPREYRMVSLVCYYCFDVEWKKEGWTIARRWHTCKDCKASFEVGF